MSQAYHGSMIVGLLFAAACGQPTPEPVTPTFAPTPELSAYTSAMAERYARATGREDIVVADNGQIPVYFEDDLWTKGPNGEWVEACGMTSVTTDANDQIKKIWIRIDPTPHAGCEPIHVTLLHEGLHALAPKAEHTEEGMFALGGGGSRIDDSALNQLCAHFTCELFQPE